ncbi:NAD-dependent epimerase/dehydratase [Rhodopirellula maiorica SM1]|uniref:NAD-dependent epimerase/dehydratase n=1 Tax=Rhodopirellula maiorica SM1 TaxID=1265738 RepID=M5RZ18_9BACT|nr:NAD(P)-dependent oxidoreductase [Rhodopirellula maiorica]EMI19169.1 NAD-dependent epimerase/dehydratase [Rhodopirellula maiorica SM1]
MKVALTGATGFIGRYIAEHLASQGHSLRCCHRPSSDTSGFDEINDLRWIEGELGESESAKELVDGCDAVVHAALYRPGTGFSGGEGDVVEFVEKNVVGTLKLIEAARSAGAGRFVAFSTCAVHDIILADRPLDETHPLWAKSHYGAHKAAIEKFVHSYGLGQGYPICALRPTGVYGVARPVEQSKWYDLVSAVVRGKSVECSRGGKEVHAADVAKAVGILLTANGIAGEAFNCYDRYVSQHDVATIAKQLSGSDSQIIGEQTHPKNQIVTDKIKRLGMEFGGDALLRRTVAELVKHVQQELG